MVLRRPGPAATAPLEAADVPEPAPGDGEILLVVAACAVCRTDLQLCEGDLAARRTPIVPGHQAVGRVAAVGRGRGRLARGRPRRRVLAGRRRRHLPRTVARGARTCASGRPSPAGIATAASPRRCSCGPTTRPACPRAPSDVRSRRCCAAASSATARCGCAASRRAAGSASTASAPRPSARSRSRVHMGCEVYVCTRSRARARDRREASARPGPGATTTARPSRSTPRSRSRPSATSSSPRSRAVDRGGTVAINAIHLDRLPEIALRAAVVGALAAQRRQRHAGRRRRVPRPGRGDPGADDDRDPPPGGRERRPRPAGRRRGAGRGRADRAPLTDARRRRSEAAGRLLDRLADRLLQAVADGRRPALGGDRHRGDRAASPSPPRRRTPPSPDRAGPAARARPR